MLIDYFLCSERELAGRGKRPVVAFGTTVGPAQIRLANAATGRAMPSELEQFYIELGDGFFFVPDSGVAGWEANVLEDYIFNNSGFLDSIEEEAAAEIRRPAPRVSRELIRAEAESRKSWVPFYGFVGGGDMLCIDGFGRIRFYEALNWRANPATWDFVLARSLLDFVRNWSKYCFVSLAGGWASFCFDRSGVFDWNPRHFVDI